MVGPVGALRIAFFGTPEFAVPTLERLTDSGHRVVVVVTQPDRPRDRGLRVTDSPVKQCALRHGLPLLQPTRMKDEGFLSALEAGRPDLGVVAAYGRILTERILAVPSLGMLNVHASILPKYRGAAPIQRAVMAGEPETGVTIMRVVQALDAGPIVAIGRRPIGPDETSDLVERDLATLGANLLVHTLGTASFEALAGIPQEDAAATYAPRVTKDEGLLDWSAPARVVHDRVRGLHPWPHAYSYLRGVRLIIHRTAPADLSAPVTERPGTVLAAMGDRLLVATGHGQAIDLVSVQAEGKRPAEIRPFLAGHHVEVGWRFGPPDQTPR